MAFSDFQTIAQVIEKYPLKIRQENFLPEVELELPDLFVENLNFSLEMRSVDESEAFFRECFIFPFLHQVWKRHRKLKLWSHPSLACDRELYGELDYLVSAVIEGVADKLIDKPFLAVAEAKREDFAKGWAQCLAEMIACQKINDDERAVVYGIVPTGLVWEFGKLERDTFTKHFVSYAISAPNKIYGILDFIFAECERQIA